MKGERNVFYCQKVVGDEKFSIDEWNNSLKICDELKLSEEERSRILFPEPIQCKEQCTECITIVNRRRRKTLEILNRK